MSTDPLSTIYLFCFGFGLIFSVVSVLLRFSVGRMHLSSGHIGHQLGHGQMTAAHGQATVAHGHGAASVAAHEHAQSDAGWPSPFNLSSLMVFLTWFGAAGYILHTYYGALAGFSLIVATVVGWVGAALIYIALARVLRIHETQLDPANYQFTGTVGRVTSSIQAGGTGEIVYTLDGKRRVDGARSQDGTPIPSGTEVAIVRYRDGLVYVVPLDWADQQDPEL